MFASIPIIAEAIQNVPFDQISARYQSDPSLFGLPPWTSPLWEHICSLFRRPWFHRLWIMQEVCLSSNIIVLCGQAAVKWETLELFASKLFTHIFPVDLMARIYAWDVFVMGLESVVTLEILRKNFGPEGRRINDHASLILSVLLCSIRQMTATKPIDKVFGALAMMPSDVRKSFVVDVSESQAQVYATFARCLFERGDASLILCHASHSVEVECLPSWCPDFAETSTTEPIGAMYTIWGFAAGHEPVPSGKERIKFLEDWSIIAMTGFEVGLILDTVSLDYVRPTTAATAAAVLRWNEACVKMIERHIDVLGQAIMFERLCEVIVAGGRMMSDKFPLQPASQWVQDHNAWRPALQARSQSDSPPFSDEVHRFTFCVDGVNQCRRVFIGKDKFIGLAPAATQAGDLIYILYGRPTPFILRANPDKSTYRLIGEAYVNGIMDGEAFQLRDKHSLQDKTFIIK